MRFCVLLMSTNKMGMLIYFLREIHREKKRRESLVRMSERVSLSDLAPRTLFIFNVPVRYSLTFPPRKKVDSEFIRELIAEGE